ncbi:MAG: thiamine-phosphate kinase [Pseudomonadota bacterium]
MDEFELIERYFAELGARRDDVRLGVGDDGALIAPAPPGQGLVMVTDTIIAGVHFPDSLDAAAIGHRVLAVNLSDLAAMGAQPAYALLALSMPQADLGWLREFARGLGGLAAEHGVALVGGDTTRSDTLTLTVTAVGWVPPMQCLARSGAREGDLLVVSGNPGDAAAGLAILQSATSSIGLGAHLRERFAWPTPRVGAGLALRGIASAAIDISDGLLADSAKLAQASGVHLEIDVEALPLSHALLASHGQDRAEHFALFGGDDYELLFTIHEDASLDGLCARSDCALTVIGRVHSASEAREAGCTVARDGVAIPLDNAGYRHFS